MWGGCGWRPASCGVGGAGDQHRVGWVGLGTSIVWGGCGWRPASCGVGGAGDQYHVGWGLINLKLQTKLTLCLDLILPGWSKDACVGGTTSAVWPSRVIVAASP